MHSKINDDIFVRFLVIMTNVVISFIKEYRVSTVRPPCGAIDDVIIMKNTFLHNLERSFNIWAEVKFKLCLIF